MHGGLSRALQTSPLCDAEPHSCGLNIYQWFCLKAKGARKKLCSLKVGCRSWKTHPKSTTHVAEPEQHQQVWVYESWGWDCNFLLALKLDFPCPSGNRACRGG